MTCCSFCPETKSFGSGWRDAPADDSAAHPLAGLQDKTAHSLVGTNLFSLFLRHVFLAKHGIAR